MTKIKDIYNFLDTVAPFDTQEEWDNSGLIVGDMDKEVKKVLLSLDITNEVVKEAKNKGCELIISHHPVIFSPLSHIGSDHVVYSLIKSDVSALCAHTNLDKARDIGVNACLAKALGLNNTRLYPDEFLAVGELESAMSSDEFANYVKDKLSTNGVKYTSGTDIKTVGVSSGGGGDAVYLKDKFHFDALVTGELKHHLLLFSKEHNFTAVEAGHFETEDVVINPLINTLNSAFSDVQFEKSQGLCKFTQFC